MRKKMQNLRTVEDEGGRGPAAASTMRAMVKQRDAVSEPNWASSPSPPPWRCGHISCKYSKIIGRTTPCQYGSRKSSANILSAITCTALFSILKKSLEVPLLSLIQRIRARPHIYKKAARVLPQGKKGHWPCHSLVLCYYASVLSPSIKLYIDASVAMIVSADNERKTGFEAKLRKNLHLPSLPEFETVRDKILFGVFCWNVLTFLIKKKLANRVLPTPNSCKQ